MLVGKGALTFRTFEVGGKNPTPKRERILERLDGFSFKGIESADEGSASGWVAPEHLFDGDFDAVKIFRGRFCLFALRIDTRRVPAPLLEAHTAIAIKAALDAEGGERLPARRKREIKQDVKRQLLAETPPVQRAYGVFWNVNRRRIHLQSTAKAVVATFQALFERTFDLDLEPQVPGLQAAHFARAQGVLQTLQDARPLEIALAARAPRPELAVTLAD